MLCRVGVQTKAETFGDDGGGVIRERLPPKHQRYVNYGAVGRKVGDFIKIVGPQTVIAEQRNLQEVR